jgi:Rieske Fe-S protein
MRPQKSRPVRAGDRVADLYPPETGRRRFVKGVVGGSALAATGVTGSSVVQLLTTPSGRGGGVLQYFGIELTDGPAPRGMPLIPVRIDSEGFLSGVFPPAEEREVEGRTITVAQTEIGGTVYSPEWFQYCGVQSIPAVAPGSDQDDAFRYDAGGYAWQREAVSPGQRMHVDDVADYREWRNEIGTAGLGKPATGTWRSVDVPGSETLPIQVVRVSDDRFERMLSDPVSGSFVRAAAPEGFLAWLNKCTHFCCVPGYKQSQQAVAFGAADAVYCPCHQSVYDPFSVVQETFVALPRPEE